MTMPGCATRTGARWCGIRRGWRRRSAPISTAENNYADAVLAPLAGLRAKLVAEMKGRIQPQDIRRADARRAVCLLAKIRPRRRASAHRARAARRRGRGNPCSTAMCWRRASPISRSATTRHSPDHRLFAYTFDDSGSESYTLWCATWRRKRDLPDVIKAVSDFTWADSERHLLCPARRRAAAALRLPAPPRHRSGQRSRWSTRRRIRSSRSRSAGRSSGRFVVISDRELGHRPKCGSIETAKPESEPGAGRRRATPDLMYGVDDWGDRLVIRTNADGAEDFKIVTAPLAAPGRENWRDLVPYREGRRISRLIALAGHLVRLERENGLGRIVIRRKSDGAEHAVSFDEEAYRLELTAPYEYDTRTIRFTYSSPSTPRRRPTTTTWRRRERVLRKEQTDSERPRSRRLCGAAAVRHDRRQGRGADHGAAPQRHWRSTARRRCFWKATAPMPSSSRPASMPTSCRWSIAASSTPSRMSAAASRKASAGATPDAARTRPTRSRISSRSRNI